MFIILYYFILYENILYYIKIILYYIFYIIYYILIRKYSTYYIIYYLLYIILHYILYNMIWNVLILYYIILYYIFYYFILFYIYIDTQTNKWLYYLGNHLDSTAARQATGITSEWPEIALYQGSTYQFHQLSRSKTHGE